MKTAFFILGVHRSGTSALGGVLNILGLEFGSNLMSATEMNPKGYFENMQVFKINENILNENNSSWNNSYFNIDCISTEKLNVYKDEIKEFINKEFRYAENFVIKDPRICLLFPIWESVCLDLDIKIKILLPYRNPVEVANSLKKRDFFSFERGLVLWASHFLSAEFLSRKYDRIFLSFDELLNNSKESVAKLCDFIEIKSKKRNLINNFLDKKIKHNNSTIDNFSKEIPSFFENLLNLIKESNFENIETFDKIRKDFVFSLEMFQHEEILESINNEKKQKSVIDGLNKQVALLENIKDTATLDKKYYLEKYSDLKNYGGDLIEHYYSYGKDEGRKPNQYCEILNINTKEIISNSEIIYSLENQLKQKEQKIYESNATIGSLEHVQKEKDQEITSLNQRVKSIITERQQIEDLLKSQKSSNNELNKQILELQKQIQQSSELLETKDCNNSNLKDENLDLQNQIQHTKELLETKELKNNELNDENLELQNQIQQTNELLETKELKNNELNDANLELQKQTQQTNELLETKELKNNELNDENLELQKQIQQTNALLETRESKNNELNDENLELQKQIQQTNELLNNQKGKSDRLLTIGKKQTLLLKHKVKTIEKRNKSNKQLELEKTTIQIQLKQTEEESKNKYQKLEKQFYRKNQELDKEKKRIAELQEQNSTLYEQQQIRLNEIDKLNIQIDEIIEDLVSIKESKCWIYTKPIRNLQSIFKDKK